MDILRILEKKKQKQELSKEEIKFFVDGIVSNAVADYQASAFLMAVVLNGMTENEVFALTDVMKNSGSVLDFSSLNGTTVDKHSTGGVGDSTTFVVAPIMAALGYKVAKMSGRGLGFTGGTLDKLESYQNMNVALSEEKFLGQVADIGIAISGQSKNICPADKILYSLRDVTATVDSIPLIASSIMSKKLAVAADILVLDVKCGDGSLLGDFERTRELAKLMVKIGKDAGKKVRAILTSMDEPLDSYIGNSLEIEGALAVLNGEKNGLFDVATKICAMMLSMDTGIDQNEAMIKINQVIESKQAYKKFEEMIFAQCGQKVVLPKAKNYGVPINSDKSGYIEKIHTKELGKLVMDMGGGRKFVEDKIDHTIGIKIEKRVGDYVEKGEPIAFAYANNENQLEKALQCKYCYEIGNNKKEKTKLIYEEIC